MRRRTCLARLSPLEFARRLRILRQALNKAFKLERYETACALTGKLFGLVWHHSPDESWENIWEGQQFELHVDKIIARQPRNRRLDPRETRKRSKSVRRSR